MAQEPLYNDRVAASDPLRTEQARELERYIQHLKTNKSRRISEIKKLRVRFAQSIGWPPPGWPDPKETASFTQLGEDSLGVYYRAMIPILPSVHAEGIYITPKSATGRVPLVISMHGGGGSPEVALFNGGANYHDMVRGGVKNGYAVFAPQHLFRAEGFPGDVRTRTDERLKLLGTSLTAVEIAKITRSLDVLLKRPELDPKRVAMVGLSYGGYYALVTPALEPRIKVAVSSCYFGVQEWRYERDELSVPTDFRFSDRFTQLIDSDLVALICPRPLLIQAGKSDNASHREGGVALAPASAAHYKKVGKEGNFEFLVFEGGHEFHDPSAWAFLKKHL
jgi:dienelactone hydrolase